MTAEADEEPEARAASGGEHDIPAAELSKVYRAWMAGELLMCVAAHLAARYAAGAGTLPDDLWLVGLGRTGHRSTVSHVAPLS